MENTKIKWHDRQGLLTNVMFIYANPKSTDQENRKTKNTPKFICSN